VNGIQITASESRAATAARSSLRSRTNDRLGWLLLLIVAAAPIPLGSHRPFFWATNAVLIGAVGLWYTISAIRNREELRVGLREMGPSALLVSILIVYLAAQAVPIATLIPPPWLGDLLRIEVGPTGAIVDPASISLSPGSTLLMLLRWLSYGLVFALAVQVAVHHQRRDFMLNAALVIIVCYAVFGLASLLQFGDTILGMEKWAYQGDATATFVNRNSFATFLSFGAVIAVALVAGVFIRHQERDATGKVSARFDPIVLVYGTALITIVAALLATQSRMGALSGMLGSAVVLVLALQRIRWRLSDVLLGGLLLLSLGGAVALYGFGLLERLGSVEASADVRLDLYRQIVGMIANRPLLGYGGGAFEYGYALFHQLPVSPDLVWDRAHNTYLALWSELGLVAGSIPLVLVAIVLGKVVWRLHEARLDWPARAAAAGTIVVAAVHSLADFSLEVQAVALMFTFLLGLGTSAALSARKG
jgi:O-antigen ligase